MANSRIRVLITLTDEERAQLTSMARSRSLPAAMVLRARIVLACEGENKPTSEVADKVRTSRTTGEVAGALCRASSTRPVRRSASWPDPHG